MDTNGNVEDAIDLLQQLGLKEYEARCFVGLCRLSKGTAKQLSEITDVPRTRVYDATRVLEKQGLVEVHHSSPQEFRAVPLSVATATLRAQYEGRIDQLERTIAELEDIEATGESTVQEVWSLAGSQAIANRVNELVGGAESEIVLVLGDISLLTDELVAGLNDVGEGVDTILGTVMESHRERIENAVPTAEIFASGLEWLRYAESQESERIGRLMLVDRSTILVSSIIPDTGEERAIFGEGFGNGLVVIARRIMAGGALPVCGPGDGQP